jgi:hypothetical protein
MADVARSDARTAVIAAGALAAIGALHVAWAAGASWPCADRERLARAVDGVGADRFPGAAMSLAVGGLLFTAGGLLAAHERGRGGRVARLGTAAVGATLLGRGIVGLVRPGLLPAGDAPPFARLNATVYSPLCLALGAAAARSAAAA